MKQVMICRSTDLVNGGCNACPTVKSTVYSLELNGLNRPLEQLDVPSIVMTIALAEGFEQHQEYDVLGDVDIFTKGDTTVTLTDDYMTATYTSNGMTHKANKVGLAEHEIFETVNAILVECFHLEAIDFTWDDIN